MAEDSAFWGGTTVGDAASADIWKAPYSSEEWSDVWSKMFASDSSSGFVIPLHDDELAVVAEDPASMDISVLSGVAQVRGRLYENTTTATLTIAANASGSPRIDRIILRTSFAAQTIRLAVLQGTPGGVPALPTLTQDANTWEVSLAYVWVANGAVTIPDEEIHDERLFLRTSLSHKYGAGSQNLIKNSEFMGFSELSGGATTNPPDLWNLVATPLDVASATKYSGMPRGRAVQITADGANEGISQTVSLKSLSPLTLKIPVKVTAGDVGSIEIDTYAELAKYSTTNQNVDVLLRGFSGAGGTATITGTGTSTVVGDAAGQDYWIAQSLTTITSGKLSQITFTLLANGGSPTGDITWEIRTNNAGVPSSTILQTGTITPTPSAVNTINITDGVLLSSATTYWLALHAPAQANDTYYAWDSQNASDPDGNRALSTDGGASWTADTYDCACTVTTSAVSLLDKLAQSFQINGNSDCSSAQLWLKKTGAPAGTLTLRIETNNAGSPSGALVDANATATVAENTLTASYTQIEFAFSGIFSLTGSTTYWLVLSTDRVASNTNYVLWGADDSPAYASGEMKSETGAVWSSESKDACFLVVFESQTIKYIRRTGSFIEELLYITENVLSTNYTIKLMCLNNGDIVQFGQCLLLEGRHPGPFREIHETILFKDGITDSNWAADAKSDGTTTIDLDSDFQALVLPGTRQVLLGLIVQETTTDVLTTYATSNQDTGVELQGAAGIDRLAQSFQVAAPATVDRISLYLKKTGSPTGSLTVYLETNAAGSPSGTLVHADSYSYVIPEADLSTSYVLITFYLRGAIALAATTTYWIDLYTNRASDAANFITWGADSSAPAYASGEMKSQNGGSWSAEAKDACFVVLGSINLTSYLAARFTGGSKDYVKASCLNAIPLSDYYEQGWVDLNPSNQFDLYVVDTTASSIVCSARILGINI